VALEGDQVATIGKDLVVEIARFGPTIPDALRDLAAAFDREGVRMGPLTFGNGRHGTPREESSREDSQGAAERDARRLPREFQDSLAAHGLLSAA
jgi:hypothetical protein